jgi:NADPH2:quinone reductase
MTTVTVNDVFDHPAEEVWAQISDFGNVHQALRGVDPARVEGTGLGQERIFPLPGGDVVERLTWCDPAAFELSYTIVTAPLPLARYVATVRLTPDGERCQIEWQGNFDPDGQTEDEAIDWATRTYRGMIKGYKALLAGAGGK